VIDWARTVRTTDAKEIIIASSTSDHQQRDLFTEFYEQTRHHREHPEPRVRGRPEKIGPIMDEVEEKPMKALTSMQI
jgi:hypothetical protein